MGDIRFYLSLAVLAAVGCDRPSNAEPAPASTAQLAAMADETTPAPVDRVDQPAFSLVWESRPASVGGQGQGTLTLTAKAPFKCNQEYPHKLKLSGAGAEPARAEISKDEMQVALDKVVIPVTFTVKQLGRSALDATLAFSVCTDEKCLIERQPIQLSVQSAGSAQAPSANAVTAGEATGDPPSQKRP